MISQGDIDRINALARKSRTPEGLTDEERAEQMELRRRYVAAVRENLTAQLDHTVIQRPDGSKTPLKSKDRQGQAPQGPKD